MAQYTEEFKKLAVKKALLNPDISPRQTAKEMGVSNSAIYKWIKEQAQVSPTQASSSQRTPNDWTVKERFNILLETVNLDDESRGAFCRQHGLYQHQLTQWRKDFMREKKETKTAQWAAELKTLREENKSLKNDLNRKDKALAEVSALLVLKKKASLIWGEHAVA